MTETRPGAPRARNLELGIALLVLSGAAPATMVALFFLWQGNLSAEVSWTVSFVVVVLWVAAATAARQLVARALMSVSTLLGAFREGDYSIRGLRVSSGSAMALVMREVNDLGSTLQRQRAEALESTALLTHVMEEIGVAVFAFDPADELLLVNKAGVLMLGPPAGGSHVGSSAAALGFDQYLGGSPRRLIDRTSGGRRGRYEMRRARFYRNGRPHHLIVMADLSQALREQEQAAWQRIVRVLSHEINNSLTPIKSIAHSLGRIVERAMPFERADEVRQGLSLVEERSGALGRFLRKYAELARLPRLQPRAIRMSAIVNRIVELEGRLSVIVEPSPDIELTADSDQLEQLLINVIRNAVDASIETGGAVRVGWRRSGPWIELHVDDDGVGLADTANLFVPFFTTKPNGSGIGLALSRQIVEAHQGTISLENRTPGPGCRATIRMPILSLDGGAEG